MTRAKSMIIRAGLPALVAFGLAGRAEAGTLTWKVYIAPASGGSVRWSTSAPAASGTLTNSGSLAFNAGAYVDLTFSAKTGYQLTSVMKNADQIIGWLDGSKHFRFGPVDKPHVIVAVFSSTSASRMNFPDGLGTEIADVTGNYSGTTRDARDYDVDIAMDEAGKLNAMGTVDGITPKAGGAVEGAIGSVKTVNNVPTAALKGSFTGTRDSEATTASGTYTGPVQLHAAGGGHWNASGVGSGNAKAGSTSYTAKPTNLTVQATSEQAGNVSKDWSLNLAIRETGDEKTGAPVVMAGAILTLPNGDRTSFAEKPMSYSPQTGYSVSFSKGVKLDALGNPTTAIDTKSTVTLTGMSLAGAPGSRTLTGGKTTYTMLGQTGKESPEETLLNNGNIASVVNNPTAPTTFTIKKPYIITYVSTYHWNSGRGTGSAGQISLRRQDGTVYGPWQATGSPGMGGVPSVNWECRPLEQVTAGTYTVVDSSPTTWSQNSQSNGQGFSVVKGRP